jgi:integrase
MSLAPQTVKYAKAQKKTYKLVDTHGLYLLVKATKSSVGKYWRLDYRFDNKRKTFSMGTYPIVSLKVARQRCLQAKQLLERGIDPSIYKRSEQQQTQIGDSNSFAAISNEWYAKFAPTWSKSHSSRVISYLSNDVFPWIGATPINELRAIDLIPVIERVANRGALDAAKRVKGFIQQVFTYAVMMGKTEHNPAKDINIHTLLPPRFKQHYASIIDPIKVGQLMRDIECYQGTFVVRCALRISSLVMLRPAELRQGEWSEIDFEQAIWKVPVKRMKALRHIKSANRPEDAHIVPLSWQAVAIFKELQPKTGKGKYIFPGAREQSRCISDNTLRTALRTMGYSNQEMTPHGFRSMASTLLNEMGKWNPDAIERQLSHKDKNVVRRAYNHAQYLDERRVMLQDWANYLDTLRQDKVK